MKRPVIAVLGTLVLGPLGAILATQPAQAAPSKPFAVRIGTTAVISGSQPQQVSIPVSGRCATNTAGLGAFTSVIIDQFPTLQTVVVLGSIPCTGRWQTVVLESNASEQNNGVLVPGKATATVTFGGTTVSVQRQITIVSS
jgi:hypothetical protein